jgi:hypothetical protein
MQRPGGSQQARAVEGWTDLEGILFLDGMDRGRKLSELGEGCGGGGGAAVAGTRGLLGGEADEPLDRAPRRGWHRCRRHVAQSVHWH